MTQWTLVLFICSLNSNVCLPPFEWNNKFNNQFDCMVKGYESSLEKTHNYGKEEINKNGIYIKFSCTPFETI